MDDYYDDLFVAATRPKMKFGVTLEAGVINFVVIGMVFIGAQSLYALGIGVVTHCVCWACCSYNKRFFQLIVKKGLTNKPKHRWNSSSSSPSHNTQDKTGDVNAIGFYYWK